MTEKLNKEERQLLEDMKTFAAEFSQLSPQLQQDVVENVLSQFRGLKEAPLKVFDFASFWSRQRNAQQKDDKR